MEMKNQRHENINELGKETRENTINEQQTVWQSTLSC